jgi:hypothetical protein
MEQTAVEYIEKAYSDASYNMMIHKIQIHKDFLPNLFEKAKEIENQQIIDAYQQGFNNAYFSNPLSKEQYYNEKFNK